MNTNPDAVPDDLAMCVGAFCLVVLASPFILCALMILFIVAVSLFMVYPDGYGKLVDKLVDFFTNTFARPSPVQTT